MPYIDPFITTLLASLAIAAPMVVLACIVLGKMESPDDRT